MQNKEERAYEIFDDYPLLINSPMEMRPSIHEPPPKEMPLFEKIVGFRVKRYALIAESLDSISLEE